MFAKGSPRLQVFVHAAFVCFASCFAPVREPITGPAICHREHRHVEGGEEHAAGQCGSFGGAGGRRTCCRWLCAVLACSPPVYGTNVLAVLAVYGTNVVYAIILAKTDL